MMFKIGVDCDGVLMDFTSGYTRKLEGVSGKKCTLTKGTEPHCWGWPTEYGFSEEDDDAAWASIKKDQYFWATLPPTMEAPMACGVLNGLYLAGHEVYFITHRMGLAVHAQTMVSLRMLGIELPQVLVTGNKGPIAQGLGLTHFIDDKFENCCDVAAFTKGACKVFLLNKAYNTKKELPESLGIIRVDTIKEFFDSMAFEEVNSGS